MPMPVLIFFALMTTAPPPQEGFVVVNPDAPVQVTKLHDEGGEAERPPSWMLDVSGGLWLVDFLAAAPGASLRAGMFWRPAGDWWLGVRIAGAGAMRRHDLPMLKEGEAAIEVQRHFLLHPEANRFVMGHVSAAAGAAFLDAGSAMGGPFVSVGAGVGVALSYDRYLGIRAAYSIPAWVRNETQPREYASFFLFSLFLTQGF